MTRLEHLLTIAGEECSETHQRCSKALRFGIDEVQATASHGVVTGDPDESLDNRDRIRKEYSELVAMMEMLDIHPNPRWVTEKKAKVEKFLRFSSEQGTLSTPTEFYRCWNCRRETDEKPCQHCGHLNSLQPTAEPR